MSSKTCNTCNLTLDISEFYKKHAKCKKCLKKHQTCEHDSRKQHCPECNPKLLCKHDILKWNCPECNPQYFCEHEKQKSSCPECNPKLLCEHGSRKQDCRKCSPQNFCKHNILKYSCPVCNPKLLCKHNILKYSCPVCNPKVLCEHDTRKSICHICSPQNFCIHCKHIYVGKLKYVESLDKKVRCCIGCFYHFYPNDEIPRRFKCKQHYFNEKLIEEFGVNFFQYDKKIKCGCSGRKPDWFIDCYKYSIIIELDEDQHKYTSCDEKRMMELFTDLGSRPLVLIRINPDKYKGKTKKRKGCFDFDEKNTLICNEKKFNKRFNILVKMIKYYIDNEPEKEITMQKLFFDRK